MVLQPLQSADMARVLLAWELGEGLGHVVPLGQLAKSLKLQGHQVRAACTHVNVARPCLAEHMLGIVPAPHQKTRFPEEIPPPRDRREIVDGILWVLNTGVPWRDLPTMFGPWATTWDLFDKWNANGTLLAIIDRLRGAFHIDDELWCVDGTVVRAHKCASGGGKKGMPTSRRTMRSVEAVAV